MQQHSNLAKYEIKRLNFKDGPFTSLKTSHITFMPKTPNDAM